MKSITSAFISYKPSSHQRQVFMITKHIL